MSLEAMVWVLSGDAPVADVSEYAVLGAMADKADSDGCGTWLSKETLAARTHVSEEQVKRCWRNMTKRGLIAKGDQRHVRHYRADRRPVVYDLLIPYTWFSNIDRINADRQRHGLPPLTPADRPPIAPAPAKKARADKGKPRPKKSTEKAPPDQGSNERGNSEFPRSEAPETPDGGTTSRPRGNYESSAGELQDPQYSQGTQSEDSVSRGGLPVRPSMQEVHVPMGATDGRTDAGSNGETQEQTAADSDRGARRMLTTPGMDVLRQVAERRPELALSGKVLSDQARHVNELVAESEAAGDGWTVPQLVAALAVPLDSPIRKTPGAVISHRISRLPLTPHTAAGMLPEQANGSPQPLSADGRTADDAMTPRLGRRCPDCGADSLGGARCPACLGWPECEGGCGRRQEKGGTCDSCETRTYYSRIAPPTIDGTCPGIDGTTCGRPVISLGLCRHCTVIAEQRRAAIAAQQPQQAPLPPF